MARRTEIPLVATNDVHYANSDVPGPRRADLHRHRQAACPTPTACASTASIYFKDEAEMLRLFDGVRRRCTKHLQVASAASSKFRVRAAAAWITRCPTATPRSRTAPHRRGRPGRALRRRHAGVRARLDYELGVIETMVTPATSLSCGNSSRSRAPQAAGGGRDARLGGGLAGWRMPCALTDIDPFTTAWCSNGFLNPERVVDCRIRHRTSATTARRGNSVRARSTAATAWPRSLPSGRSRRGRDPRRWRACSHPLRGGGCRGQAGAGAGRRAT